MASNLRSGIILFPLGFHCLFSLFQSNETNVLLLPSKCRSFWKAQKMTLPVFEGTCKHLPERPSTGRDGHYEYHQQTSSGLARLLFVFPENILKKYLQGYDRSWSQSPVISRGHRKIPESSKSIPAPDLRFFMQCSINWASENSLVSQAKY